MYMWSSSSPQTLSSVQCKNDSEGLWTEDGVSVKLWGVTGIPLRTARPSHSFLSGGVLSEPAAALSALWGFIQTWGSPLVFWWSPTSAGEREAGGLKLCSLNHSEQNWDRLWHHGPADSGPNPLQALWTCCSAATPRLPHRSQLFFKQVKLKC